MDEEVQILLREINISNKMSFFYLLHQGFKKVNERSTGMVQKEYAGRPRLSLKTVRIFLSREPNDVFRSRYWCDVEWWRSIINIIGRLHILLDKLIGVGLWKNWNVKIDRNNRNRYNRVILIFNYWNHNIVLYEFFWIILNFPPISHSHQKNVHTPPHVEFNR